MKQKVRTAVFPVGGLGTRFLPATKAMPKEMLPVVDKPLIQYALEEAQAAGIDHFVFVTGRGKAVIEDHFDHSYELEDTLRRRGKDSALQQVDAFVPPPGRVAYTRQMQPLGLGHAVACAAHLVGREPFAVLLADDLILSRTPCLKQMVEAYEEVGGNIVAAMEVAQEETSRYGIITAEGGRAAAAPGELVGVKALVEKPAPEEAPSRLAVIGRYILQPEVFDRLSQTQAGAGGEIQLTDAMAAMIGETPFHALAFEGERFDCGDKAGFLCANLAFGLARSDIGPSVAEFLGQRLHALYGSKYGR
ncbi:UTP--glucose-1-phosphate uridylyltransferase GalU [Marinibaculum pumilum]|uniref:UTP--glucose-1-phosphate uridylyltransferase n=1 Tax=Marinibaculum pumilum TaxID=1766165 RepID=A0ABV7KZ43_9PROT